jgi:hypothetical protein
MIKTLILAAMTAVSLIFTPVAGAAPDNAVNTIAILEAQGNHVIIDRVGDKLLSECSVTSVRNPQTITRLVRVNQGMGRDQLVQVVVGRTVNVSLDCT